MKGSGGLPGGGGGGDGRGEVTQMPGRVIATTTTTAHARQHSANAISERASLRGTPGATLDLVPPVSAKAATGARGVAGKRAGNTRTWLGFKDERQAGAPGGHGQQGQHGGHGRDGTAGPHATVRLAGTPRNLAGECRAACFFKCCRLYCLAGAGSRL